MGFAYFADHETSNIGPPTLDLRIHRSTAEKLQLINTPWHPASGPPWWITNENPTVLAKPNKVLLGCGFNPSRSFSQLVSFRTGWNITNHLKLSNKCSLSPHLRPCSWSKILGSQKIIALSKMALMVFNAFGDPRKTHVQEGNGESTGGVLSQGYPILSSSWPWLSDTGDPRGAHIEPRLSSGQRLLEVQDQSRRLRERRGLWLGLPGD